MTKAKNVKDVVKKRSIKKKLVSITKAKNVKAVAKKGIIKKKLVSTTKAKNNEDVERIEKKENKRIKIKKKVVNDAILVLKKVHEKFIEGQSKKPLLEDSAESPIFLQLTLKKIPPKKMRRIFRVQLPHSLMTDTTEVCLFTGDLDKKDTKADYEPTVLHYKELLTKHDVTQIKQVIPLRQLRTEYKTFEARRQLSAAYDVFLADKKISGVLPVTIGKSFYQRRRVPIQFNLSSPNLKERIERALSETEFSMTCRGNSCTSEVARLSMTENDILENILASVKSLEAKIPGKGINILGIYIKTARSQAIPIYMSFDNPNEIKIKAPRIRQKTQFEELSTFNNAEVKVFKDGRIEVKYTPGSEDENSDEEESKILEQEEKSNSKECQEVKKEINLQSGSEDEENSDEEESRILKQEEESNSEESQEVKKEINFNEKHSKTKKRKVIKNNGIVEGNLQEVNPKNKGKANGKKIMILEGEQKALSNAGKRILKRNKVVKNQDTTISDTSNEVTVPIKNEESKVDKIKTKKRKSVSQNIKNGQASKVNSAKRLKLKKNQN